MVRRAPFGFRSAVPQPSGRLGRGRPSRQLIDQMRETLRKRVLLPTRQSIDRVLGAKARRPRRSSRRERAESLWDTRRRALRRRLCAPIRIAIQGLQGIRVHATKLEPPTVPRHMYQEEQISTIARPERTAPPAKREPPRQPRQTAARPQPATTGAHPGAAPRSLPAPSAPGKILCIAASGPGAAARPDQTVGDKQRASVTSAVS